MEKSLSEKKALLREHYRGVRSSIKETNRLMWDKAIMASLMSLPRVITADVVFSYLSRSGEVSTLSIIDAMLGQKKLVLTPSPDIRALPRDGFFEVSDRAHAEEAFIPKPSMEKRAEAIDVILVPGIVWDKAGYRVGFGGGYFDRLLSTARPDCLKIGLAYECQMEKDVPLEHWDQQTDLVITESHVYDIKSPTSPLK